MARRRLRLGCNQIRFIAVTPNKRIQPNLCLVASLPILVVRAQSMSINSLELKVPPPLVAAILAAAMWGVSLFTPHVQLQSAARVLATAIIALIGVAFAIAGFVSFRRAKTTVSPVKPDLATSLVSSGVYAITRNPMYVGLLFVLVAWAISLSSAFALVGPMAFFFYIGRFQIEPEERVLANLFGSDYANYRARVRRWL